MIDRKISLNYLLLATVIVVYLFYQFGLIPSFQSLPSPIYGGDYYYQLGSVVNIYRGGNPFDSSNTLTSNPVYLPLYSILVAFFGRILSLEPIKAMLNFSYLIMISAIAIYYYLSRLLLKNGYVAVITALLFLPLARFPVLRYTEFAQAIMMPLFFITLFLFIKNMNYKTSLLLALVMGLATISHSSAFICMYPVFFLMILCSSEILSLKIETKKADNDGEKGEPTQVDVPRIRIGYHSDKFRKLVKDNLKYILLAFTLSFIIAQLCWFEPIFIYQGKTRIHYLEWNSPDYSNSSVRSEFLVNTIKGVFLNLASPISIIKSMLSLLGVVFILKFGKDPEIKYLKLLLIIAFAGTFHYFLTMPLLNTHFVPYRIIDMLIHPLTPLLAGCGLMFIYSKAGKDTKKYIDFVFVLLIVAILVDNVTYFEKRIEENKWIETGKNPIPSNLNDLSEFVTDNTKVNDVFLTSNEVGFALNALTGAKLLTTRRAHSDAFMDMDSRVVAAAIILYGNDTDEGINLLEKYEVKYLYWDYYWIQSEYYFDEQGNVVGWFDPLILFDTPENREILDRYDISYFQLNTWIDPALKGDEFKKFDLLFISPQNYRSFDRPWKSYLDEHLEEVWSYSYQGEKIAVLYRIKTQQSD